jgi:SAM-dependent methyltransferase
MRAWVEGTVDRLRRLGPRRVLEIGCGTGLILFQLAPDCDYYLGTDLTNEAIAHVRHYLGNALRGRVELVHCAADEIGQLQTAGDFDLIILNSVVQYFPDIDYLLRIVELAASLLSPNGTIFLGDVRTLPLLEPLALAVESGHLGNETKVSTLRDRVRRRLADERELALAPSLFAAMVSSVAGIGDVRIEPKRGRYDNELSRYRLDVSLTRKPLARATGDRATAEGLDEVRSRLAMADGDALLFEAIPNLRTAGACAAVDVLTMADDEPAIITHPRTGPRGIEPEDLYDLAAEMGWQLDLQVSTQPEHLDAYFTRGAASPLASWPLAGEWQPEQDWHAYGNQPLRTAEDRRLVLELRELLARHLVESVLPNHYLVLHELPLTPNGKIDRRALSRCDCDLETRSTEFVAPRTAFEETIAGIWAEILGVEAIGRHDDFFELGGHSLLAAQVVARLRVAFDIDIPLRLVFEQRTVAEFATAVERIISDRVACLSDEEAERLMREEALP